MNIYQNLKISSKFNLIVFITLVLFAFTVGLAVIWKVDTSVREIGLEKVKTDLPLSFQAIETEYNGDWLIKDNQLYKGNTLINGNEAIVDYAADLVNGNVSIYLKDQIIATNLVHNDKRLVGIKAEKDISKTTLENGKSYFGESDINGELYQSGYQPIKNASGEIIGMWYVGASQGIVDAVIAEIFLVILISSIILLILAYVLVWLFTNSIKKRLNKIASALDHAGNGDFSSEVDDHNGDEIGHLANGYMLMREKLSNLILYIKENSEQVAAAAEQLNASSEETSRATDAIAQSIQEVASSSDYQSEYVKTLERTSTTVLNNINEISEVSNSVLKASEESSTEAKQGGNTMNRTMQQVGVINEAMEKSATLINHLGEKSKEIDSIVNIITEITEQTNLLALNAAIEAARAGEHGRGFAVVADEVRKLAEQSNQSASQIRNLIGDIQTGIKESIISMEVGRESITDGLYLAAEGQASLIAINHSSEEMYNNIYNVTSSIEEIRLGTKEMDEVIQSTVEHIQSTSGLTQTVAASAEEQNAAMQEVAASAQSLSKLSENLADSVNNFKLK